MVHAQHHNTEINFYFCDSEGGVENINGLIREYFSKGSNLDEATDLEVQMVEDKLNNRPRKKNNHLTPDEVLAVELEKRYFYS